MAIRNALIRVSAFMAIAILLGYILHCITENAISTQIEVTPFLLIDPGHGGMDGGASTADGALEDDINLAVSLRLRDMLKLCGYPVQMTRETDTAIVDEAGEQSGWKREDMHHRLDMYNAAAFTISIHQNHFSQTQYHGAQLFYSTNRPESKDMANSIQQQIVNLLQPDNQRQIKAAGENIFLLHHTTAPAVIVECGFLSNPPEAEKLQSVNYQQQMAFAVCCGILQYAPLGE